MIAFFLRRREYTTLDYWTWIYYSTTLVVIYIKSIHASKISLSTALCMSNQ